jgi:hypothetical protein
MAAGMGIDRANHRIEPGAIAAAGENADALYRHLMWSLMDYPLAFSSHCSKY